MTRCSAPGAAARLAFAALIASAALTGCTGVEGNILRTIPDAGPPRDATLDRPGPVTAQSWQIQLSGTVDTSYDVELYTVDIDTPRSTIDELHAAGRTVICYLSAGTFEPFRSDAGAFPPAAIGAAVQGYPENWIDFRDATVRSIMQARIFAAVSAGCDGIHPSNLFAYRIDSGFTLSFADQLGYDRWIASVARGAGLSVGLVDGDAMLAPELVTDFDWTVVWDCIATQCGAASPFVQAGKAAFLVETGDASRVPEVCPLAKSLGLSAIIKNHNLDAFRVGCT